MVRVSVIIPTYNYARFLGEAVKSVLDQTFGDFELIIVDDGSTDNTREVVEGFRDGRIRYVYQANRGVAAAQNTGVRAAEGEYVAILGADDIWLPESLELRVKLLESRPDVALVCSDILLFENETGRVKGKLWHDMPAHHRLELKKAIEKPLTELISWGCFIWPQGAMIRRFVFDEIGYFDESLTTCEDWDLFLRIARRFAIDAIDMPLARVRIHGTSLTASTERMYRGEVATLRKLLRTGSLSGEEARLAKKKLVSTYLNYGRKAVRSGRLKEGREALLAAIRLKPRSLRPYLHLVLSCIGKRGVLAIRKMKQRLGHGLAPSHAGAR